MVDIYKSKMKFMPLLKQSEQQTDSYVRVAPKASIILQLRQSPLCACFTEGTALNSCMQRNGNMRLAVAGLFLVSYQNDTPPPEPPPQKSDWR